MVWVQLLLQLVTPLGYKSGILGVDHSQVVDWGVGLSWGVLFANVRIKSTNA